MISGGRSEVGEEKEGPEEAPSTWPFSHTELGSVDLRQVAMAMGTEPDIARS